MLALLGSGEYLSQTAPIDRFLLNALALPPRVVCLPTAAGTEGDERVSYWCDLGKTHFETLGAPVQALRLIDRAGADDPAFERVIRDANFIYLSGGKPAYLFHTLNNSRVWRAITEVVRNGGVLAGCSAGAMILGQQFFSGNGMEKGFGFLPGLAVLPHFDEIPDDRRQALHRRLPGHLTLIGIDACTALIYHDRQFEVMGKGVVSIFTGQKAYRFSNGPVPAACLETV